MHGHNDRRLELGGDLPRLPTSHGAETAHGHHQQIGLADLLHLIRGEHAPLIPQMHQPQSFALDDQNGVVLPAHVAAPVVGAGDLPHGEGQGLTTGKDAVRAGVVAVTVAGVDGVRRQIRQTQAGHGAGGVGVDNNAAASQLDLDNATAAYESATANVLMSEADLMQAATALGYTTVQSPITGYISASNADIGTLVGPGGKSLLATIVKSDTVRVDFSMTGMDYLRSKERNVNLGQKDSTRRWNPYITVTLPDNSRYPLRGLVDFADPQVDPETGTFSVRAEMPNPDHILLPGQFTKVKLLLDVRENAVVVPSKAIVIEKGGAYIFVVRPDSVVEKRFIETGPELDNKTVVERGLLSGERIVVEGYHKLNHGMRVEAVEPWRDNGVASN